MDKSLRRHIMMQVGGIDPNCIIMYTTTDSLPIVDGNYVNNNTLVSNTYVNGVGTLQYATPILNVMNSAFEQNKKLLSMEFPDSIVGNNFGYAVFNGCSNLAFVKLPRYITSVGTYTFYSTNIASLDMPSGITTIGTYCFMRSYNFKISELPASLTSIGRQAFLSTAITDIKILNTTQKVNGAAYMFDNPIIRVPNDLLAAYQADSNWSGYRLVGY